MPSLCFINRLIARLGTVLLFFACPASMVYAQSFNVTLLLSDSTPPYRQFSAALKKALGEKTPNINIIELQAEEHLQPGLNGKADLIVAVGLKAGKLVMAKSDVPVLGIMIPKASFGMLLEKQALRHPRQPMSAIYLDQPWDRQLNFIQAALPNHRIVGVLYSPDTPIVLPRLPQEMSLNAKSVRSSETLFDALENILSSSDVLLVVPDSEIYSSNNVRNILLTSYRYKVPLIGISQAYVSAGALCAI